MASLETMHMKKSRQTVYLACEELDFAWDIKEVTRSFGEWTMGYTDIWVMPEREVNEVEYTTDLALSRLEMEYSKLDH